MGDAFRSSSPEGSPLPTPPRPRIPDLLKSTGTGGVPSAGGGAPGPSSRAFSNRVHRTLGSSTTTAATASRARPGRYQAKMDDEGEGDDGDESPGVARRSAAPAHSSSSPSLRAQGLSSRYTTVDGNSSPSSLANSLGTAPRHLGAHLGMTKHAEPYPSTRPTLSSKRVVSYEETSKSRLASQDAPIPTRSSMASLAQTVDEEEWNNSQPDRLAATSAASAAARTSRPNGLARRLSSRSSMGRSTPSPPPRGQYSTAAQEYSAEDDHYHRGDEAIDEDAPRRQEYGLEGGARMLKRSQDERDEDRHPRSASQSPPKQSQMELNGHSYQTPAMGTGARTITSKGAAAAAAGSRSVARSAVKRYGRSSIHTKTNVRKPAARRVNCYKEEEEEEAGAGDEQPLDSPLLDEGDRHLGSSTDLTPESANGGSGERRSGRRMESRSRATPPPLVMPDDPHRQRARFEEPASGIKVPLGADEDDDAEEDPVISARENIDSLLHHRQKKSAAMHDIIAAKVPSQPQHNGPHAARRPLHPIDQPQGLLAGPTRGPSDFVGASAAPREDASAAASMATADTLDEHDFTARIWEEVARQRTRVFPEKLLAKLNKENSELKFNNLRFKKVSKAGTGGFSTVHAVHGPLAVAAEGASSKEWIVKPGEEQGFFALKVVTLKKLEEQSRAEVKQEAELLALLATKPDNDRYILRYFGSKCSSNSLKILLELGDEDFSRILCDKYLTQDEIRKYFRQMLEAVHFTHEQGGMLHTDLKPANFLMCNERLKLIDFGIAQKIPLGTVHIRRDAMIGTPNYMAPETVRTAREKDSRKVYKNGKASDVWSLGCILYQMVYGHPPFDRFRGPDEKLRAIVDAKTPIDYPRTRISAEYDIASDEVRSAEDDQEHDRDEAGNRRGYEYEEVPQDLIACMRSALEFRPDDRATIPELLRDAWVYSGSAREEKDVLDFERERRGAEGSETIEVDRELLRSIMRKVMGYTREGDLTEENLDERAELLFTNVRTKQARTRR